MIILKNGRYIEEDISNDPAYATIRKAENESYPKYAGISVGDFEVLKVEFDWGQRAQRWTIKCSKCGIIEEKYPLSGWHRGKAGSTKCQRCKKETRNRNLEGERTKKNERENEYEVLLAEHAVIQGMRAVERIAGNRFLCECIQCGKQRKLCRAEFKNGAFIKCNHKIVNVYDESIIGNKYGHLTATEQRGKYFLFRCDCGFEKVLRPTDVCRGMITTCGRPECEYHQTTGIDPCVIAATREGFAFEKRFAAVFEKAGYSVFKTPDRFDYGVDVIVEIRGEKWAFQCKKKKTPATSKAVMEVYAGGRFYDCTRFCVASPSGFSDSAKIMAAKLGVQLETSSFHFGVTPEANASTLLSTVKTSPNNGGRKKKTWIIDGCEKTCEEWCKQYGVSLSNVKQRIANGMDVIDALRKKVGLGNTELCIEGETKTLYEWCDAYNIAWSTFCYRVKQRKMSYTDALITPLSQGQKSG